MEATPAAQAQIDELRRRLDSRDAGEGRQWVEINDLSEGLAKVEERVTIYERHMAEVKKDVSSVKTAMWSLAIALIVSALGIIGVLITLAGSGGA